MKVIKFNKKSFLKDLDFISRNRKSNFSNKVNIVKKILKIELEYTFQEEQLAIQARL